MTRRRVVVAGTAFGRVYLDALARCPQRWELAGVLATGSAFSAACARERRVPLFTDPDQVGDDVDVVCVVVRSGVLGGPGSALATAFLRRGIHVLQEHPVHPTEIAECLRAAREGEAAYAVHTLYPRLRPVARFLAAAAALRERGRPAFLDAACNSQVLLPLLDVLGRAAGGLRPWAFAEPAPYPFADVAGPQPFRALHAVVGGVPTTLRVQNQIHPEDGDNHSYLLHRVALGTEAGVLTLADTHGPVLWNPRLHAGRDATGRLVVAGPGSERLGVASTVALGAEPGSYHAVFADLWPDAVLGALDDLGRDIDEPARRPAAGQWALAVATAWQELTAVLGPPEEIRPPEPPAVPVEELAGAVQP